MSGWESRFWAKVDKGEDHWLWVGVLNDRTGSGSFKVGDEGTRAAHRLAWELTIGPLPASTNIRRHCEERRCVRPNHWRISEAGLAYLEHGERAMEIVLRHLSDVERAARYVARRYRTMLGPIEEGDLAQEGMEIAVREVARTRIDTFENEGHAVFWLTRRALTRWLFVQRADRHRLASLDDLGWNRIPHDRFDGPEERAMESAFLADVHRAMLTLTRGQQRAFLARTDLTEDSVMQLASEWNVAGASVSNMADRAERRVRAYLHARGWKTQLESGVA